MRLFQLFPVFLMLLFVSCEFETANIKYNMGNDFINDPTNVLMIDTLTVKTFTTAIDSFATSQSKRLLAGRYINSLGIETYSEAYFRFDASEIGSLHATSKFDSVVMILQYDGYKLGDTTSLAHFEVFRLTEDIVYDETTLKIYNHQQFEAMPEALGKFTLDLSKSVDTISFKINDELGKELFDYAINQNDTIFDSELFKEYFKGVVIKPTDNTQSLIAGFTANPDSAFAPRIRVYYNDYRPNDDLYMDFPFEKFELYAGSYSSDNSNYCAFSHIVNNYKGSKWEGISFENPISSSETENIAFMQGSNMHSVNIMIPYIDNLYQFGVGSIIKAELHIEPIEETFISKNRLPSTLQINLIDSKYRYYNPLYITGTTDVAYGTLEYDNVFKEKTHYVYDVTNYVKTEFEDFGDPLYTMLMLIPNSSNQLNIDQLIIGDNKHNSNKMKLKIYLTNFNEQL